MKNCLRKVYLPLQLIFFFSVNILIITKVLAIYITQLLIQVLFLCIATLISVHQFKHRFYHYTNQLFHLIINSNIIFLFTLSGYFNELLIQAPVKSLHWPVNLFYHQLKHFFYFYTECLFHPIINSGTFFILLLISLFTLLSIQAPILSLY